jgi:hypothetical protein
MAGPSILRGGDRKGGDEGVDEETVDKVKHFTARELRCDPRGLAPGTGLLQDLGVDGPDAANFFQAFFVAFSIDSSGFNLADHFGPEGCDPLLLIRLLLPGGGGSHPLRSRT